MRVNKRGSIISVLADDDILVTRLQDIFLLPRIITWLQAQWPSPHPLWPDLPPTGTSPPSHSLTPGEKGFHFLILKFYIIFLPFCTSGKTESLWICFLEWLQPPQSRLWFLCEALLTLGFVMSFLFHTQVSYVQLVSIGQLVSNVQLVPNIHVLLQLQPGSPQTSLSLDFLVPSHSEHPKNMFFCQICRHGLLGVNVIEALKFKHLPLFQHQATVVAFSGTFHASDSAEMISPLNHKRLS